MITGLLGATAAGLRFQKGHNVAELIPNSSSIDSPERAADVQSSFVWQHFHAAPADGGVHMLIDPRPWDRWHLCEIDGAGKAAHIVAAMPVSLRQSRFILRTPSAAITGSSGSGSSPRFALLHFAHAAFKLAFPFVNLTHNGGISEPLVSWTLPNGETLWVIHFELSGLRGLDDEAEQFRRNVAKAKKLDGRSPLRLNDSSGRIMIAGTNDQGWFSVIDAALS